jgi:putative FmdB family regulatory protein
MPIYEYVCSACATRTEILHGIHDPAPSFCPVCGAEGTLRKGIAAPAVVFKGSGWAKKDRRATSSTGKSRDGKDGKDGKDGSTDATTGESKPADGASSDAGSPPAAATSGSTEKPAAKASEGA